MMKAFFMQYQLAILLIVGGLLFGYIFVLNMQVVHYKNKTDNLTLEVKNWQFTYNTLAEAAKKQNQAVSEMAKIGEDMHRLGQKLLNDVRQANTIRQPKINAATIRLNSLIKTDCATAIADAKKELQE